VFCVRAMAIGRSCAQAQTDKNFPSCLPSVPGQANGSLYSNLFCPVDPSKEPQGTLPDMQTAEAVLQMLRSRDWQSALPLFLAVGFHKPHIPFKFPAEYLQLIPPEEEIGLAPDPGVSVSRAFPSYTRSILTEIYLCHPCSCHEIEDGNARGQPWLAAAPGSVAFQPWHDVRSRQDIAALRIPFPYGRMPDSYARKLRRAYLAAIAWAF
jgi:iduronate 2-sulfatase